MRVSHACIVAFTVELACCSRFENRVAFEARRGTQSSRALLSCHDSGTSRPGFDHPSLSSTSWLASREPVVRRFTSTIPEARRSGSVVAVVPSTCCLFLRFDELQTTRPRPPRPRLPPLRKEYTPPCVTMFNARLLLPDPLAFDTTLPRMNVHGMECGGPVVDVLKRQGAPGVSCGSLAAQQPCLERLILLVG